MSGHHSSGENSLAATVFKGSVWLFGSYALSRLGRIAMMLVVAAVLFPREYGLIGLSGVFITAAQLANECVWPAVVHRANLDERFPSTAFTVNVLGGFITTIGLFIAAPWVAYFYGDSEMTSILRVMGLALIADGIFYVPDGLLRKELRFRSRVLPEIAGTFGAGVVTVTLLLLGVGVLSYATGFVVESITRCLLTIRQIRKTSLRPKLQVSWLSLREIVSYSKHILGADLARHVASNIDYLIVGRVLGAGPLGLYTLAFNLANYPVLHFSSILSRVVFPTFATLQEDLDYARRSYLKIIQVVAALVTPLLVVLALLATPLVVGLLGEKWQPAVFPLQVMAIAGISRALSQPGIDIFRAMGHPNIPFKINLLEGLTIAGGILLVAPQGIEAVALTVTVILSLASWAITVATCRKFEISLWALGGALMPGVVLAMSGAAPILSLKLLGLSFSSSGLELIVLVTAAGLAIVICLATVFRDLSQEIVALAASVKRR